MGKNAVLPYAIIAILGVLTVIIMSYIGVNQRETIQNPEESGEAIVLNAEDIYKESCMTCHGSDLSGASAPDLTKVGGKYDEEEIKNIIIEGTEGGMPPGLVDNESAAVLATWLADME